jgi:uncharacterized lipoprotein YddW (UPF0748 family)/peptidoglycan/xylan/chitin deacetylase (PgdA/CDA1 family)
MKGYNYRMFFSRPIIQSVGILAVAILLAGCAHTFVYHSVVAPVRQPNVPILLYHHIGELPVGASPKQKHWTLSPEKFNEQMRWVAEQGFHPITMAQLTGHLKLGSPLPVKPIVISFDDGWKDQYCVALPILKKYNFPATFFIIADSVGHSAYMNWDEVLEMSNSGMDIESHSCTHQSLPLLPPEQARLEIEDSKRILENHLHKPVSVFAYPFGTYDNNVISMVKDAGFDTAVTVEGLNCGYLFQTEQSYVLARYAVRGENSLDNIAVLIRDSEPVCPDLFVSLLQEPPIFSSRDAIDALIDFAAAARINRLFVQVYRENKAWFPSEVAGSSPYEKFRKDLSEDPFARIITQAHRQGIQVYAWLNLLSLTQNQDAEFLKKYGTDVLTRDLKEKKKLSDYLIDEQYFLEPGDQRVRQDLAKIIAELLRAYPELDGIQLDYIRYPDMRPHYGYTQSNVERFKKATGLQTIDEGSRVWKEWKRAQVTELLTLLVNTARTLRPDIQVSATGCMPYSRAYHEAYQDWVSWLNRGLVDFITVMDYSPNPDEFKRWLAVVREEIPEHSKVKIGVGVYKLVRQPRIFARELRYVEELGMNGAIFNYGSLLESPELRAILIRENNRKSHR